MRPGAVPSSHPVPEQKERRRKHNRVEDPVEHLRHGGDVSLFGVCDLRRRRCRSSSAPVCRLGRSALAPLAGHGTYADGGAAQRAKATDLRMDTMQYHNYRL